MKHTIGPWETKTADRNRLFVVANDYFIAQLCPGLSPDDADQANARLIAAAPDMLAALQDAEFLMRQIAIDPSQAGAMVDSLNRSAGDARNAIQKASA